MFAIEILKLVIWGCAFLFSSYSDNNHVQAKRASMFSQLIIWHEYKMYVLMLCHLVDKKISSYEMPLVPQQRGKIK